MTPVSLLGMLCTKLQGQLRVLPALRLALTTLRHFRGRLIPNYVNLERYTSQILTFIVNDTPA